MWQYLRASKRVFRTIKDIMNDVKVLISNPDDSFRRELSAVLRDRGFEVTALSGDDRTVLERIREGSVDIAIIEYGLISGSKEFFEALLRRPRGTEIILTCRQPSVRIERAARSLSPAFYFVKPIGINDVYSVVLRIIETKYRRILRETQCRCRPVEVRHG